MAPSVNRLSALFANPDVGDAAWGADVISEGAIWKAVHAQIVSTDPPERFEPVHTITVRAFGLSADAADQYRLGVETLDADYVNEGTRLLDQASEELARANEMVVEMTEDAEE